MYITSFSKIKNELFGRPEDALCVKRCLVVLAILEIYFFSMRLRSFIVYFVLIIMSLNQALSFIIRHKHDRTQALVEILKNSVKEANTQERIIFLLECKRANIIPRFIGNTTKNARKLSKNESFQRRVDRFSFTVLNEALRDAYRHRAFLWRQRRRLLTEVSGIRHPLIEWTLQEAQRLFWSAIQQNRKKLEKKFSKLTDPNCLPKYQHHSAPGYGHMQSPDLHEYSSAPSAAASKNEATSKSNEQQQSRDEEERRPLVLEDADAKQKQITKLYEDADLQQQHSSPEGCDSRVVCMNAKDTGQVRRTHPKHAPEMPTSSSACDVDRDVDFWFDAREPDNTDVDLWFDTLEPNSKHATTVCTTDHDNSCIWYDALDSIDFSFDCVWFDAIDDLNVFNMTAAICDVPVHTMRCTETQTRASSDHVLTTLQTTTHDKRTRCKLPCLTSVPGRHTPPQTTPLPQAAAQSNNQQSLHAENIENIVLNQSEDTGKLHNLTSKPLPHSLTRILEMGPKFALSRSINKRVIEDAEIGFERGAFALRWRHYIEAKRTTNTQETHLPTNTDDSQTPSQCVIPRFADSDTKMAPAAPPPVEHELRRLKHKVISTYKTHKAKHSNHTKQEREALEVQLKKIVQ